MANVTFLLPGLGHTGEAKQVSLLAPRLAGTGWTVAVDSVGGTGPFATPLEAANIPVRVSTCRHLRHWMTLRRLGEKDGVVHVFGLTALRRLWLATLGGRRPKVVATLTGREQLTRIDRRALGIADRLVVPHTAAAVGLIDQGMASNRVVVVPPAVADAPAPPDRADFCRHLGIPADAPLIVSAGRMDSRHPMFGSVWAFEFLRYTDDAVRLLMIGDGPGRERIEAAARGLAPDGSRVLFLGSRSDVPSLFGLADLVAVPHARGGTNATLEAMAAGRAVVATDSPELSAIIWNRQTGLLTRAGHPPEQAAAIRRLLLDPAQREQLGQAAREHVRKRHSVDMVVRAMEDLYRD